MANIYLSLEEVIKNIFKSLATDLDFIKLMSNDAPTALTDVTTKTFNDLLDSGRISLLPKKLEPTEHQGSYAFIYFNDDNYAGANNVYQKDLVFKLVFLSHKETWELNDWKVRPYRLLHTIREGLKVADVSGKAIRGKILLGRSRLINDGFYMGYEISFEITGLDGDC